MDPAVAARRIPALAVVAGAHALAVGLLLELTRTHPIEGAAEETLTVVEVLPAAAPRAPEVPRAVPPPLPRRERAVPLSASGPVPSAQPPAPERGSPPIDWAAQGADAAGRVARGEDNTRAARTFGIPPPSATFDPAPPRRPGLAWNHARTHRVEALPGGVTVFNLNDHCALALVWVVPFFGCQIGKIPVRGDLFEHMRDMREPDLH